MSRHAFWAIALGIAAFAIMPPAVRGQAPGQTQDPKNPQSCAEIWQAIGLPEDEDAGPVTTICHLGYITGHNDSRKAPNWVVERLTPELTKKRFTRDGLKFSEDTALNEKHRAVPADYERNQPFDQGHNAPAADFSNNKTYLADTFFLSNSVPQVGLGFNRSIWRSLETQVRGLVGANHPVLYVITGSVWQQTKPVKIKNDVCNIDLTLPVIKPPSICPATADGHANAKCAAGVSVPAGMFKIVYDPGMENAFAVLMTNENHTGEYRRTRDYIEAHRVGISTIEQLTGLNFFSALPAEKRRQLRDACVDVRVH